MGIIKKSGDQNTLDLIALAHVLLKKLHFILLCMVIFGVLAYAGVYYLVTPTYRAEITLYVANSSQSGKNDGSNISANDIAVSARLVKTYSQIISSRNVMSQVIDKAGVDMTPKALAAAVKMEQADETEILHISVVHPDPETAALLANTIAEVAPPVITATIGGSSVKEIDTAEVPTGKYAPNYGRAAMIGALLGLLLSIAYFTVRALFDNTVKSVDDFSQWEYPVLACIPDLAEANRFRGNGYYGYAGMRKDV